MGDFEDDVLALYDDEDGGATIIISSDQDEALDDAASLTLIVSKTNGDGAVLALKFDKTCVVGNLTMYAESRAGARRTTVAAHRPQTLDKEN